MEELLFSETLDVESLFKDVLNTNGVSSITDYNGMNKNLNLSEMLKDCPENMKLYYLNLINFKNFEHPVYIINLNNTKQEKYRKERLINKNRL